MELEKTGDKISRQTITTDDEIQLPGFGWYEGGVIQLHIALDHLESLNSRLGPAEHALIRSMRNILESITPDLEDQPVTRDEAWRLWTTGWKDRLEQAPNVGIFWRVEEKYWPAVTFEVIKNILDEIEGWFRVVPQKFNDEFHEFHSLYESLMIKYIQNEELKRTD